MVKEQQNVLYKYKSILYKSRNAVFPAAAQNVRAEAF